MRVTTSSHERRVELTSPCRDRAERRVDELVVLVAGVAEVHEPLPVDRLRHLLEQRDPPPVVLDQVVERCREPAMRAASSSVRNICTGAGFVRLTSAVSRLDSRLHRRLTPGIRRLQLNVADRSSDTVAFEVANPVATCRVAPDVPHVDRKTNLPEGPVIVSGTTPGASTTFCDRSVNAASGRTRTDDGPSRPAPTGDGPRTVTVLELSDVAESDAPPLAHALENSSTRWRRPCGAEPRPHPRAW